MKGLNYLSFTGRILIVLFLLSFFSGVSGNLFAEEKEYRFVVAEGVAAIVEGRDPGKIYDEALHDAKRNAVNMGVGVLVNSETIVENYQMISDKILSQSAGYVREFEVISKFEDNGLYRVVINAEVAVADINSDLVAIAALKQDKGYPRIMLIGVEKIDDQNKTSSSAQTAIEGILIDKGFDLVDESQVEIIKARDIALNSDDPGAAAALGLKYGAEIIIVFQAIADYGGTSDVYGAMMHSFRGTVDARIIYTDTSDMLGSVSSTSHATAEGKPAAVRLAFQKTAKKAAPAIIEKILNDWQKHTNKIELIIRGLSYSGMKEVKKALKNMRRVKDVASPEYSKGIATFRIQADLKAEELADRLLDNSALRSFQIYSLSPGRIEAEIKGE
jgi:hypothetical protein